MTINDTLRFAAAFTTYTQWQTSPYRADKAAALLDAFVLVNCVRVYDAEAMAALDATERLCETLTGMSRDRAIEARDLLRIIVADSIVEGAKTTEDDEANAQAIIAALDAE